MFGLPRITAIVGAAAGLVILGLSLWCWHLSGLVDARSRERDQLRTAITSAYHARDGKTGKAIVMLSLPASLAAVRELGDALDSARLAGTKAIADNLSDVRSTEGKGVAIAEDKQHDLESQLAAARAAGADYARRLRPTGGCAATPYPGGAGQGGAPQASVAPGGVAGAGGVPVMDADDVRICSVNTVKLRAFGDFYADLRSTYNAEPAGK